MVHKVILCTYLEITAPVKHWRVHSRTAVGHKTVCTATTVVVIAKYITVVCLIFAPFTCKPSLYFPPKFLHRYSCLTHWPPNYIWPRYQNSNVIFNLSKLLYCQLQGLCGALTTEQLSIASVFVSGVSVTAHGKDKPAECLENTAVCAVGNLCQSILTKWYSSF